MAVTLTVTVGEYYAPELRDRDHTAFIVSKSEIVFEDEATALDWVATGLGIGDERAAKVLARRCEFQSDEEMPGRQFKVYRFAR